MLIYLTVNLKYICFIYIHLYKKKDFFFPVIGVAGKLSLFFCSVFILKMFKDCECVI